MSEINTQVLQDGDLAIRTVVQNGDIVSGVSATDTTALVQTAEGKQLCVKVVLVGPGGAAKPKYVDVLPEEGEEGVLYMVNSGVTRDGYAIFQMFSWHEGEWVAIGAYDVGIDPVGIVYEDAIPYATSSRVGGIKQSFNATTGTWTVITENL